MNGIARTTAWLAAGAGIGLGSLAGFTTRRLNSPYRPWPPYTFTPFEVRASSEDVAFTSDDDVALAGWWLDRPESESVVICCHGHRGNKADMLGIGSGLWRAGYSVLLFDFRGNGDSADGPQSLAHYEQRDVRAAVNFARRRRPDARIAALGFSMGAAASIMAAADDQRIEAVVADSSFAAMDQVIASAYRRYRMPGRPLVPFADLANRAVYGYSFKQVRPVDRIGRIAPRPVLLLHATADRTIPFDHLQQLAEAAETGTVEVVSYDGAEHCGGYFEDRAAYIDLVADFLNRKLPQRSVE